MDRPGVGRAPARPHPRRGTSRRSTAAGSAITIGAGSVATHGSLAAFGEAHARDGRLPWRELVAPAVDVARGGFALGSASRYYLDHVHESIFGWDPASHAALHDAAGRLTEDRVVVADLAATLELIATDGPRALHEGDLADAIAADVGARGGLLGRADLAAYAPVVREPLTTRVAGWSLATTTPPSVGGVVARRDAAAARRIDRGGRGTPTTSSTWCGCSARSSATGARSWRSPPTSRTRVARVARPGRRRPPGGARVGLDGARVGHRRRRRRVLAHGVVGLRRRHDRRRHRHLAQQLPRRAGAQPARPRRGAGLAPAVQHGAGVGRHDDGSTLAIGSPGADRITTAVVCALAGFVRRPRPGRRRGPPAGARPPRGPAGRGRAPRGGA